MRLKQEKDRNDLGTNVYYQDRIGVNVDIQKSDQDLLISQTSWTLWLNATHTDKIFWKFLYKI